MLLLVEQYSGNIYSLRHAEYGAPVWLYSKPVHMYERSMIRPMKAKSTSWQHLLLDCCVIYVLSPEVRCRQILSFLFFLLRQYSKAISAPDPLTLQDFPRYADQLTPRKPPGLSSQLVEIECLPNKNLLGFTSRDIFVRQHYFLLSNPTTTVGEMSLNRK